MKTDSPEKRRPHPAERKPGAFENSAPLWLPALALLVVIAGVVMNYETILSSIFPARRGPHPEMTSNTQLRGIHQIQVLYAQSNDGKFTNDISDLVESNYFTPDYVLSHFTRKQVPADYLTWSEADRRDWVRKNASFILVPNLTDDLESNRVAGFIRPQDSNHPNHGSVVYNDNQVEWNNDLAAIDKLLQQQNNGLSMQDMIRMQETAGE